MEGKTNDKQSQFKKKSLPQRYDSHNRFLWLMDKGFPSESVLRIRRIRTVIFYDMSVIYLDADYDSKLYSTTKHCWGLSKISHL